ncbi:MAG: FAD-dependent oxidoreductase [Alphaproteobacteria bacterium]
MWDYQYPSFDFAPPPELQGAAKAIIHPVVIVGGGPVGLTAALDLAQRGHRVIVLEQDATVSDGSRAICWAQRSLEIFDRLGVVQPMVETGITWSRGKVFRGDRLLYGFDLSPGEGFKYPPFVNLQQYMIEDFLIRRVRETPNIDLRWQSTVEKVAAGAKFAAVSVATPAGGYTLKAEYVLACDGARSAMRRLMGLDFTGRVFEDRFLIADVRMKVPYPNERLFWFYPSFHKGTSALMHRQAKDEFRVDFQLGPDVDPEEEAKPENVRPRLKAMLGPDVKFDFGWVSVYRFQSRRLEKFRHGRVIFAGDSAHQMSPFGGRGGNCGLQDADNLVWKLDMVLRGVAPDKLLDSYDVERIYAADEHLRITGRTTDFMSAKDKPAVAFRDAVLGLAEKFPFARGLINAGRLSVATKHAVSPLSTPDSDRFSGGVEPGSPALDAPCRGPAGPWFIDQLPSRFCLLAFGTTAVTPAALGDAKVPVEIVTVRPAGAANARQPKNAVIDTKGLIAARYDAKPGTIYLFRPDRHVAARWRRFDRKKFRRALSRALGED